MKEMRDINASTVRVRERQGEYMYIARREDWSSVIGRNSMKRIKGKGDGEEG